MDRPEEVGRRTWRAWSARSAYGAARLAGRDVDLISEVSAGVVAPGPYAARAARHATSQSLTLAEIHLTNLMGMAKESNGPPTFIPILFVIPPRVDLHLGGQLWLRSSPSERAIAGSFDIGRGPEFDVMIKAKPGSPIGTFAESSDPQIPVDTLAGLVVLATGLWHYRVTRAAILRSRQ